MRGFFLSFFRETGGANASGLQPMLLISGHSPAWGDVVTLALYNPMEYKFQFTALGAGRGSLLQLEGGIVLSSWLRCCRQELTNPQGCREP